LHSIVRWTTILFRRRWRRSLEKVASLDIEDACDPVQDIDTCRVKVRSSELIQVLDFSTMREFLLRDASHLSQLSQIER